MLFGKQKTIGHWSGLSNEILCILALGVAGLTIIFRSQTFLIIEEVDEATETISIMKRRSVPNAVCCLQDWWEGWKWCRFESPNQRQSAVCYRVWQYFWRNKKSVSSKSPYLV